VKSLLAAKLLLVLVGAVLTVAVLAWVPIPGRQQSRASVSLVLNQGPQQVWRLVSDLKQASNYVPDIERVEILSSSDAGVGASGRLYKSQTDWLDETVTQWYEGQGLTLRLHRGDDAPFPFASASFEYRLQPLSAGATAMHLSLVYQPRYGLLGQLLDGLFLAGQVEQRVMGVAQGLKQYSDRSSGQ
jgi:ribosome-associated toxin RatA of RatAB toxin-antitoxin module